jgi:DNA-directed RNA polymerase specialized sigma54-like protein
MSSLSNRLYQSAELRQEMKINPRLYQAMELLYMPLLDLQQHLKQELAENPFLEMTEADVAGEVSLDEERKEESNDDEIDWEEILLDGFDAGGLRGPVRGAGVPPPHPHRSGTSGTTSWNSSTTSPSRTGRSGWERRSSGTSRTRASSAATWRRWWTG